MISRMAVEIATRVAIGDAICILILYIPWAALEFLEYFGYRRGKDTGLGTSYRIRSRAIFGPALNLFKV